jgi:MFS family permease
LALCSLFFVVAGIQFWYAPFCCCCYHDFAISILVIIFISFLSRRITPYLVSVLKVDLTVVVFGFTITSATAPIFGVLFGGWMVDRLGGYKGVRGLNVAAKSSAIFGLIAVLCGVPAIFITSFLPFIALIWLLLFFGGAVLPPATGIVMSSVPQEMRAMSNSVSMLLCAFSFPDIFIHSHSKFDIYICSVFQTIAWAIFWGHFCLVWWPR